LLRDGIGLLVADDVKLSTVEIVAVCVSFLLGPVVTVSDIDTVGVKVFFLEAVTVLVPGIVNVNLLDAEDNGLVLAVLVCVIELETVLVICGVFVTFGLVAVPDTETVEVLEDDDERVNIADAEFVRVSRAELVVVFVPFVVTVDVTLAVDVLELVIVRETLGEADVVLDDDTD